MKKRGYVCLGIFWIVLTMWGVTTEEVREEASRFVRFQQRVVGDTVGVVLTTKRDASLYRVGEESFAFSGSLSYGVALSPLFSVYREDFGVLVPSDWYGEMGVALPMLSSHVALFSPSRWMISVGMKGWKGTEDSSPTLFGGSFSCLYEVITETPQIAAIKIGGGYSGIQVSDKRFHTLMVDGEETSGIFSLSSFFHGVSLECLVEKSFFFLNNYLRLHYLSLMGNTEGFFSIASVNENVRQEMNVHSFVVSGGFEVMIGFLSLSLEFGRDMVSSATYVDAGLRFTF
ncbi:MAG: hypothetical protein HPY78_02955 [Brevinematales bacterium]|nr:hypothetical protein [Brevinematales bacterium]